MISCDNTIIKKKRYLINTTNFWHKHTRTDVHTKTTNIMK